MDLFQVTPDPPHTVRATRAADDGPHPSNATGWAVLVGFLAFTAAALVLYVIKLGQAAP